MKNYQDPNPECTLIAHVLCMYKVCVEAIYLDVKLILVPTPIWTERTYYL